MYPGYWVERLGWELGELRYAILARIAAGPVTLQQLISDLMRLHEEDVITAYPSLVDVVEEVRLYRELGLVEEGGSGRLYLNHRLLPGEVAERVWELAERIAESLGAPAPAASEEAVA